MAVLSVVDPFPPGRLGFSAQKQIAHYEVDRIRNGAVRWLETHSADAAIGHEPVDFIFIDGDHSEQGTLQDWLAWKDLVQPGGIVAIHDSRSTPTRAIDDAGSVKVTNEVILRDDRFEAREVVDSLTVLARRVYEPPYARRCAIERAACCACSFSSKASRTFDSWSDSARFAISR